LDRLVTGNRNAANARALKSGSPGHSLGAALATLAADRLPDVQGLYTFGSPRVGDKGFQAHFRVKAYRLVNGKDIVPTVPGEGPFRHVGELIPIAPKTVSKMAATDTVKAPGG
jgi:predicted lipase